MTRQHNAWWGRRALAIGAAASLLTVLSLPLEASADDTVPTTDVVDTPLPEDAQTPDPSSTVDDPPGSEDPSGTSPSAEPVPSDPEPAPEEPTGPSVVPTEEMPGTADPESPPPAPEALDPVPTGAAPVARRAQPKVTICHRTSSRTNPYNQVVVSRAAAIESHASHVGPVFAPDVDDWGDIIPPIRPGLPTGLNWPEGRSVLNNGCEVPPDVGPLPAAAISDVACTGAVASLTITVLNRPAATAPATFTILVDGTEVQTVGPVAPGTADEVVLSGDLEALEDQTFTIAVTSGGEVIASRVVTVDCEADPPSVEISAQLTCSGAAAQAVASVVNNGQQPVEVTVQVDGVTVGESLIVAPGTTETGTVDLSPYEDQTVEVTILVEGDVVAAYTVTPDCVAPQAVPRVAVDGLVCPPPSATVTLANDGDPDSRIVFSIRINGRLVQVSAPIYGGDSTTIVGDLSRYEDQRVSVELRANGEVLGSRSVDVDCVPAPAPEPPAATSDGVDVAGVGESAEDVSVPTVVAAGAPPATGSPDDPGRGTLPAGLVVLGCLVMLCSGRRLLPTRQAGA